MAAKKNQTEDTNVSSSEQSEGIASKAIQLKEYFEESKAEIRKVTWPTRKEAVATSVAVLVMVVIMSLFLGVMDFGLTRIIALILS